MNVNVMQSHKKEADLLIGVVGMGLDDTLNEVEMAYFIDEEYQ